MIRCFLISALAHLAIIIALLALSVLAPPVKHYKLIRVTLGGGMRGAGPKTPPMTASANEPQSDSPARESKPTPKVEAKPVAQATSALKPAATPAPKPPRPAATPKPIIKATPAPPPKAEPKIVETKKAPVANVKKVFKKDAKLVEPKRTPVPTPKPTATPEPLQEAVVSSVEDTVIPEEKQVASLPSTPVMDSDKPTDMDKAETSAAPPPAIDVSKIKQPGGKGVFASKNRTLSIGPGNNLGSGSGSGVGSGFGGDVSPTYYGIVLDKIEQHFKLPYSRAGLECRISFRILKDGTITNINVIRSTQISSWDQFAVQALEQTGKLPELYDSFHESFLDVVVTFNYERRS